MEKDLFLVLLALIASAVLRIDLLWTVAVVDVTYRLICLFLYVYIQPRRRRKGKSPSRSAKQNGRPRKNG